MITFTCFRTKSDRLLSSAPRFLMGMAATALCCTVVTAEASAARVRQVSARSAVPAETATTLRPADRAFLVQAAEDARQQLRLAQIGVSQATSAEVRSHAQQLVGDYQSLSTALEALIRRKGGIANAPAGTTSENYRKLVETTGKDFDWEFIRTVASKSDDVLTRFEQFVSKAGDEDIRELAAAQLPVLRAHRTGATELIKSLY